MKTFQIGSTYYMRSICDYDCIWRYKVIKRTKATITIQEVDCDNHPYEGSEKVCRIWRGFAANYEAVRPLGSYSMAPVLSANKEYMGAFTV